MPEIVFSRGYKHVKLGILHDGKHIDQQGDNSPLYIFHRKDEPLINLYEKYRGLIVPIEQDSTADMLANETLLDELIDFIMFKTRLTSPVVRQFLYITLQSEIFRDHPQLRQPLSHRSSIESRSLPGFILPEFSKHSKTPNKLERSLTVPPEFASQEPDFNLNETRPRSNSNGFSLSLLTKSLFLNPMSKSLPVLSYPTSVIGSHRAVPKQSSNWISRRPSALQTTSPVSIQSDDPDSEMSPIQSVSPRDISSSIDLETDWKDGTYLRTAIPVSPNSLPKYSRSGNLIKKGSPRRKYYDLVIFETCRYENGAFNIKSTCISFQKRIVSKKVSDSLKWKLVIYYDEGFYIPLH